MPSKTNAMPSTTHAQRYDVSASSRNNAETPFHTDTTAPAVKSPRAASIDQT